MTTAGMVGAAFVGGALLRQLAEHEGVAQAAEIVDPEITTAQVAADFDALEACLPGAGWELLGSGPDGEAGTDDDIVRTGEFPAPS